MIQKKTYIPFLQKGCFFVILELLLFSTGYSQNNLMSGTIIDRETSSPIPYASITVLGTNYGTASAEDGTFSILIEPSSSQVKLKISCVGYSSISLRVDSLKSKSSVKILLSPETIILDEVQVNAAPIDPIDILTTTINEIPKNNYFKDFRLEFYSTITSQDSLSNYCYVLETILNDNYVKGNHNYIYTEQRENGLSPLPKSKCGLPVHFELIEMDLLRNPFKNGVFNIANLRYFKFKYEGILDYEKDTVYVISYFSPNPSAKVIGVSNIPKNYFYRGKIYISTSSNAVVRHSLEQGVDESKKLVHEILYRKINGFYFPYYIQGSRYLDVKKDFSPKTTNTLILKNAVIDQGESIQGFDNCNRPKYNKAYWEKYFPANKNCR